MTIYLNLVVPEDEQEAALIGRYYEFHIEKCQSAPFDPDTKIEKLEKERKRALEWLEEEGDFALSKQVPRMVAQADSYRDLFDFMVRDNPNGYVRSDPDDIETLIGYLRQVQAELEADAPFDYEGYTITALQVEADFECRSVPLCEFALEHGYGIDWEY